MSAPFQPPSSQAETPEQIRRLWRKLRDFSGIGKTPKGATAAQLEAKLNEILAALQGIVKG